MAKKEFGPIGKIIINIIGIVVGGFVLGFIIKVVASKLGYELTWWWPCVGAGAIITILSILQQFLRGKSDGGLLRLFGAF